MIRATYLATADVALDAVSDPIVDARRAEPSALPEMTVEMLAAHLLRSILAVEEYLDGPSTDDPTIDAPAYWLSIAGLRDLDSPVSRSVRERAATNAAAGLDALRARARAVLDRLRGRLEHEPADRRHGDLAVLRALTRQERDPAHALRVL